MNYMIKEIFSSIQGEGLHAGAASLFCRFSGCNVWSGRPQDRARDTSKGLCAEWCDTDFRGTDGENGGVYTAEKLKAKLEELWGDRSDKRMVVFTGGEPTLQLDDELCDLFDERWLLHVETNGSGKVPERIDWVTLSPKPPLKPLLQHYDEVKVIYPSVEDPGLYRYFAKLRYVQPLDSYGLENMGKNEVALMRCKEFVMKDPGWRLGVQLHKILKVK